MIYGDLPDKAECSGIKQALAVALVVPEPASGIGVAYSGPSGLFRGLVASDFSLTAANALNFLLEILHLRRRLEKGQNAPQKARPPAWLHWHLMASICSSGFFWGSLAYSADRCYMSYFAGCQRVEFLVGNL